MSSSRFSKERGEWLPETGVRLDMTAKNASKLAWIRADAQDRPAPGQLEHAMDFLSVGRLGGGSRSSNLWKWQGYRGDRAPHGFEGVSRSRADAARAAETAYFGD